MPDTRPHVRLLELLRDEPSLTECIFAASTLPDDVALGFIVWMAINTHRRTNQISEVLKLMALNDAQLTQAVTDLTSAFTDFETAIAAEVADLKAAITPETDQAISDAVANIDGLVTRLKADTAAAKAAVPPPADPPPAGAAPVDGTADGAAQTAG